MASIHSHTIHSLSVEWPTAELERNIMSCEKPNKLEVLNNTTSLFSLHLEWLYNGIRDYQVSEKVRFSFLCELQLYLIQDNLISGIFLHPHSFSNKREEREKEKERKKHCTTLSPPLLSNLCYFP